MTQERFIIEVDCVSPELSKTGMCLEVAQRLSCRLLELVQEQSGEMHQQPSGDMIPPGLTAFKQGRLSFLSENNHRAFIDHFI